MGPQTFGAVYSPARWVPAGAGRDIQYSAGAGSLDVTARPIVAGTGPAFPAGTGELVDCGLFAQARSMETWAETKIGNPEITARGTLFERARRNRCLEQIDGFGQSLLDEVKTMRPVTDFV